MLVLNELKSMRETTVSIIGGGACGVATFVELMLQLKIANQHKKTKICIIEKRKEIGEGLAFSTEQPGHLLNTQADLMGIHSFEPDHFSEWLKEHRKSIKDEVKGEDDFDEAYTTRRLYGTYIQEQFGHYYERAREEGIKVEIIQDKATDLFRSGDQWQIQLASGTTSVADHLVLVPGTPKPDNYPELEGIKNYFGFPWPSYPIIDNIPKHADVGLLGSSLSAIDTIMTLTDNGHQGKISLYSPDGLMPRVQPKEEKDYERQYLTLSRIHQIRRTQLRQPKVKELFRLFQQEAEHYTGNSIDWDSTERMGKAADQLLEEDIRIAKAGGDAFINILYALRYDASQIWKWLPVEEKQKFKHWFGPYWTVTRHGMPLVNAQRVKSLFDKGRLEVKSPLQQVTYAADKQVFGLHYGDDNKDEVQYLINATGPASNIEQMKSTLLQNLLQKGIIEPYQAGGIRMDTETMEVLSSRQAIQNLYAAGHICNGLLLDVNSVWFNVRTIATLCRQITKKIKDANRP